MLTETTETTEMTESMEKRPKVTEKRPKSVHNPFKTKEDMERAKRIMYLHEIEGMSLRKAALEVGYKRTKGKSEYDKIKAYLKALGQESEKEEPAEDQELKALIETEKTLEAESNRKKALCETLKRIRQFHMEKVQTEKGRQELFSSPEKMLEFAKGVVDADEFNTFAVYCRNQKLPLDKTLLEAVGPFEVYMLNMKVAYPPSELPRYVAEAMYDFKRDRENGKRTNKLRKKLYENINNVVCPRCKKPFSYYERGVSGKKYALTYVEETKEFLAHFKCTRCGGPFVLLCVDCEQPLEYGDGFFSCTNCEVTFVRVKLDAHIDKTQKNILTIV